MIYDLTQQLVEARKRVKSWSKDSFQQFITSITHDLDTSVTVDWDSDAGEGWASVFHQTAPDKKTVIAFIRVDAPLIIILTKWVNNIKPTLETTEFVVIEVANMEAASYSLDASKIGVIFPDIFWSSAVNPSCFSISDLWYTTI